MFADITLGAMTDPKPVRPNQGAELLHLAMKAKGLTTNKAGKLIDAPTGCISRLLAGKRKPGRELSAAIQDVFGVPLSAWSQDLPEDTSEAEEVCTTADTEPPPSGDVPPAGDLDVVKASA